MPEINLRHRNRHKKLAIRVATALLQLIFILIILAINAIKIPQMPTINFQPIGQIIRSSPNANLTTIPLN